MASLQKRLQNLFSTNVIVRAYGKDKLRVVDTNKLQSSGNLGQTKVADRYSRLHGANRHRVGGMGGYDSNYYMHQNRMQLYADYEMMDKDPIISSALDIYSDESTLADQFGDILTIRSNNSKLQKILYNLFYDILNIEFNMWSWIRQMSKYGDFFLKLDITEGYGIINARPFSSYEIERFEEFIENTGEYNIKFRSVASAQDEYQVYEIAHFRMISDSNFLPYGRSMLEGARKEFQKLMLMEDAMLIHRIMRAPEKRIFKIDIGNIPPNEVDSYMETIINKMKKIPHVDPQTGNYNLKFNINNMLEDYYLPVRGGQSSTQIDTLPGMTFTGMDDIEYIKHKMMAALKVPKPFLGFDEGVEGKCVSPDTKIPLIDGSIKTVAELIEDYNNGIKNYVYSIDLETYDIVAGEIEWAGYTRMNTQTVKVWLDNDQYIECTPDHKFLTRDGIWVEAQNLKSNESLMPLYLRDGGYKGNYTEVYEPSTGKYKLVHKIVADQFNLKPDGNVVHHIDFNSRNNNPDNLDCSMNFWEHRQFHARNADKVLNSIENITKRTNDPNWLASIQEAGRKGGKIARKKLAEWVRKHGPANKKEDQFINCSICTTTVKVPYYRKDTAKTCKNSTCISAHMSNKQKNMVLYNDKVKSITLDDLIFAANKSKSFTELESKLNISRNTLHKLFNIYDIDKTEFIETNMPMAYENNAFINNFKTSEYKNHKVSKIEWNNTLIDTCDITVKDYHNFGTAAGVIIHNSTLASMDIRFARTIERIQKIVVSELTKIAIVHLYAQGFEGEDLVNFELELTAPSIIYDQQKVALMNEKIQLANTMKDSKLVSDKYIYEFIFNMSEDQWLQERNNVIEDLKLRFRQNQIEQEGNDPTVTGVSYGTPHDLATVHMSSDSVMPKNKGGRPPEGIKSGQHQNEFGWDPLGIKQIKQHTNPVNQANTFLPTTRSRNSSLTKTEQIIKNMPRKTMNIITESIKPAADSIDTGTMLDENNIL